MKLNHLVLLFLPQFRHSGLNNKLKHTLKQANETGWNSILIMLKSIFVAKDEL